MKIQIVLLLILSSFSGLTRAQTTCSCRDALQNIIFKIESEYPGFDVKTMDRLLYDSFKENMVKAAIGNNNPAECLEVLKSYTGFFKDRHIWVLPNEAEHKQIGNAGTNSHPGRNRANINLKKFKAQATKITNEIEGIWKDENYEVGIKKLNANEYIGFIIKADPNFWKPDEIKFRLFSDGSYEYYMQDRSVQKGKYTIDNGGLLFFDTIRSAFIRQIPFAHLKPSQIDDKVNEANGFFVKKLTPRTTMVKMQYFSYMFVDAIEKMLERNRELLENSEFLIIDVRDNGGGTDNAYQKILPYLVTGPSRTLGVQYLASPTLISTSEKYLFGLKKDTEKNKVEIQDLEKRILQLKAKPGKYVIYDNEKIHINSVGPYNNGPSQIVVLANNHTASAAENFLLLAKQSKKTKIIGVPSSGVLDYANAMFFEYGCDNYKLLMPTYKSFRLPDYPIDNIGIQPDIYLDDGVSNWVEFSVGYLEYTK